MINDKADAVDEKHFELLLDRYQNKLEKLRKVVSFYSIMFIYCIINVIK